MEYVVVTVRVRRELWDKARRYRIDVDEVVERALGEEVARREEGVESVFESARRILERVPEEEIVRLIRSAREEE